MTSTTNENESLLKLERSLRDGLSPIHPDRYFVGHLQKRLEQSPIIYRRRRQAMTLLTIAGGLVIGTVIFLIGRGLIEDLEKA